MSGVSSTSNARLVADGRTSRAASVRILNNATISKSLSLPASQQITVRARGDQCNGAPNSAGQDEREPR